MNVWLKSLKILQTKGKRFQVNTISIWLKQLKL